MPTHTRSRSRSDVDLRRSSRRDSHDEKREKKHRSRRDSPSRSPSEDRRKHRSSRKTEEGSATKRKQLVIINQSTKHIGSSKPAADEYVRLEAPPIKGGVVSQEDLNDALGDFRNFPEIGAASQQNLIARGITRLFPVQYMTFRRIMNHEDLMVRDLTGSGKTLGFCLPMIEMFRNQRLFGGGKPLAMILAPTRELALQISKELELLKLNPREYNVLTVYGGVDIWGQTQELRRGVDIFVGTTGRVKDHMERKNFDFS
jgi:ATP-dependent helicase YprA (DUF1998 family)